MSKPVVQVINLGRLNYAAAYKAQCLARDKLIKQLNQESPSSLPLEVNHYENKLLLVEHEPVYTTGVRRAPYDMQLINSLKSLGADFVSTDRGGLITFHGYGQLTIYPVLYLGCFFNNKSIKCYVHRLEETLIQTVKKVLPKNQKVSTISEYPGVWVQDERKIAAIGVHGKRHVTTHGTCLNCNNDLSWFDHIIPCGIQGKEVTSISKEIGQDFSIDKTIPLFLDSFAQLFDCDIKTD
ncbi:putative lipoyltransferase 2, mitochondrial [Tetranychus urticae]|uniref:Octanoyl-[acyl-carrier-protein]:protein N-octanoyltransferase LIPT2, mitochondrial n=1 Tax=Tetranychus urticae TaxID=32264 RepID=T1KMB2_TETUR|nr:putative lipoyltransferase 2, mitochondrial [Tetranychus urticae]